MPKISSDWTSMERTQMTRGLPQNIGVSSAQDLTSSLHISLPVPFTVISVSHRASSLLFLGLHLQKLTRRGSLIVFEPNLFESRALSQHPARGREEKEFDRVLSPPFLKSMPLCQASPMNDHPPQAALFICSHSIVCLCLR